jgi:y4mF family transcriptional regulator
MSRSGILLAFIDKFPDREYLIGSNRNFPIGNMMWIKDTKHFGTLIRERRKQLQLTQNDLATRSGVGLRFIVELEAGKPSCQLGKALVVATEVGLRLADVSKLSASPGEPAIDEDDPLSNIPRY